MSDKIRSKEASDEYRAGWDRLWGKKKPEAKPERK